MRVLVVSAWPPDPPADGARLVLHHQLRHLRERHDITVLTPAPPTGAGAYLRRRVSGLRHLEPADVYRVETRDVVAAVRAADVDVVHLHGWGTAQLHRHAPRGTPCVHHAIDCWWYARGAHQAVPAWRRVIERTEPLLVRRHERVHYPRLSAVAVVTDEEAVKVRTIAPAARVAVVPNGVELGPPPSSPCEAAVVGMHGVLTTVANAAAARRLVDRVVPRVRAARSDVVAHLFGPGSSVGPVDDVREGLGHIAVYVAAFDEAVGVKNKVLEAMAAGLPVVATPAAVAGIGRGPGVRVGVTDDELAAHVVALLDDPAARRREGAAARERAGSFTWARSAEALERLWLDAAGRAS